MNRLIPFLAVGAILLSACGKPHGQPDRNAEALAPNEVLDFAALYSENCAACHGERGDGQGIAARFLYPKPRDFRGRFRLISTSNMVPTRDDLLAVLRRGMPGSSMPSWEHLSDSNRNLLVDEILKMHVARDRAQRVRNFRQSQIVSRNDADGAALEQSPDEAIGSDAAVFRIRAFQQLVKQEKKRAAGR